MSDGQFQLDVENHPETQLLQVLGMGPQHLAQIVKLFDHYYLIERRSGVSQPAVKLGAELEPLLEAGQKLQQEQIQGLLAASRFDVVIEDEVLPPVLPIEPEAAPAASHPFQAYAQHLTAGARTNPVTEPIAPVTESSPATSAAVETSETWSELPELTELTLPLVHQALEQAQRQQQHLQAEAQQLQQQVDTQAQALKTAFTGLPVLEEQLALLSERLENWQAQMEQDHISRESLLQQTTQELMGLQERLQLLLTQGLALQGVLKSHRLEAEPHVQLKLQYLEEMLDHVVQQRHWVHYLQQQRLYAELEASRVERLLARRERLEKELTSLKAQIAELEQINQQIIKSDPLAVPEPVPALALHELARLEYEHDLLLADPALQEPL